MQAARNNKKNPSVYKSYISILLLITCSLLPCFVMAQDPGGGPDVPIDGGLSLLLAAGVGYGVKKYREKKYSDK
ncbi:MAG: hypothetical protein ABI685_11695 [Ferruginibacter sp.]